MTLVAVALAIGLAGTASAWPRTRRWPPQQAWELLDVEAGGQRWVARAFDGHVHTSHSRDAIHEVADVVRLAELADLDAVVFTDHGSTDARDQAAATGSSIVPLMGQEVGGPYGHALVWGTHPRTDIRRGVRRMRTLGAAAHAAGSLVVLAHPGWWIGNHAHDPRRWMSEDALTRGGVSQDIDALELWSGVYPRYTRNLIDDWDSLLARGVYVPIVGDSDFHRSYSHHLGTPRTVFFCEAGRTDVAACLLEAARAGRTYLTDGPVLAMTVGARLPGQVVRTRAGAELAVRIQVRSAVATRLHLIVDGARVQSWPLGAGATRTLEHTLRAGPEDSTVRVEVERGEHDPLLAAPFTLISNPVRVDVGEARTDGWRGPETTTERGPPTGFADVPAIRDRFRHYRFLSPVVGVAPTPSEILRSRSRRAD